MKILLIGNGFDLAHNLPTTYNNFLDVCDGIVREHSPNPSVNKIYIEFCENTENSIYEIFKQKVIINAWIIHFIKKRRELGDSWGDFESEIEYVNRIILNEKDKSKSDRYETIGSISDLSRTVREKIGRKPLTYKMFFDCLFSELNDLIDALNIYFSCFIAKKHVDKVDAVSRLNVDRLISFNYTTTYTDNYDIFDKPDFKYCYIHGQAKSIGSGILNNIVLGFDDHYLESGRAVIETVPFEKYYQRIIKQTDITYLDWIENINEKKESSILYIYGHSLTPSDGDILKKLLTCEYIITVVFYRDESDRAKKVANLAVVLGPETLIKLAGETNPHISFQKIE